MSKYRQSMSDPPPEGFDPAAWRTKHTDFAVENVPKWFVAVRARYGSDKTKYACTGYCFGAPFVCDLLAGEEVSAGAFAHPTALKELHFLKLRRKCSSLKCSECTSRLGNGFEKRADVASTYQNLFCYPVLRMTMPSTLTRGGRLSISCRGRRRNTTCSCSMALRMVLPSGATRMTHINV
jgi:hypothetical protein